MGLSSRPNTSYVSMCLQVAFLGGWTDLMGVDGLAGRVGCFGGPLQLWRTVGGCRG